MWRDYAQPQLGQGGLPHNTGDSLAYVRCDPLPQVVLVKGWKSSAGWGFPKGKINEQEPKHRCAIREVSHSFHVLSSIPFIH